MSTITTLGANDNGSDSRSTINTNFSNLNTDKLEADTTATLTNKTFDANGTGNSLSNVETADIASSSKSGSDTTLITGTAGADGQVAGWNADGDCVDAGYDVLDEDNMASDSATSLATQQSIKAYVDGAYNRYVFLPVSYWDNATASSDKEPYDNAVFSYPTVAMSTGDKVRFLWRVPSTYSGVDAVKFAFIANQASSTTYRFIATQYSAKDGQVSSSDTTGNVDKGVTLNNAISEADLDSTFLTNVTPIGADDYVAIEVEYDSNVSGTGTVEAIGLYIELSQ